MRHLPVALRSPGGWAYNGAVWVRRDADGRGQCTVARLSREPLVWVVSAGRGHFGDLLLGRTYHSSRRRAVAHVEHIYDPNREPLDGKEGLSDNSLLVLALRVKLWRDPPPRTDDGDTR